LARGIRLSRNGYLAIGLPQPATRLPRGLSAGALALTQLQERIVERLAEIDQRLAHMYLGGLRVLRDEANLDRIAQSAHSIRESTFHLSNLGKPLLTRDEGTGAKRSNASNARQLEKVFDPLGGVPYFDNTLYDIWNKKFHQFFFVEVVHHRDITLEEYLAELTKYEEFLGRYVLPRQPETYALLDQYIKGGPQDAQLDDLTCVLSRNLESYR